MLASSIPYKFLEIWAQSASGSYLTSPIPQTTGSGIRASQDQGFPAATALPIGSGGTPPDIRDFNGVLQYLSQWLQWLQAGGPVFYDSAFSAAIGGYPKGTVLWSSATNGLLWLNGADNNTTNPDGGSPANWTALLPAPATALPNMDGTAAQGSSLLYARQDHVHPTDSSRASQAYVAALFGTVNNVTASRSFGVNYTNPYGRPMFLSAYGISTGPSSNLAAYVNGNLTAIFGQPGSGSETFVTAMVPIGATYQVVNTVAGVTLQGWFETV